MTRHMYCSFKLKDRLGSLPRGEALRRFAEILAEERAKVTMNGLLILEEFERWDGVRASLDSMEGVP